MEVHAAENVAAVANEFKDSLNSINRAIQQERNIRIAVSTVLSVHKPRIFESGQDAQGGKIGSYSTNPISISKKQQARQTGHTYFQAGYAQYKSEIGKNPGYVNLDNTGQMRADYGIIQNGSQIGLGFQNNVNYDKSQWMEEKYKKVIFDHTDHELDLLERILVKQLEESIK